MCSKIRHVVNYIKNSQGRLGVLGLYRKNYKMLGLSFVVRVAPERFSFSNDLKSLKISDVCRDCVDQERQTDLMVIQCNASNVHGYAFASGYLNVLSKARLFPAIRVILMAVKL